ncbi:hypothetical protein N2152v2_008884 [Parachlorella kessleri]
MAAEGANPAGARARQHVPLEEYRHNLASIVDHLRLLHVPAIVLIGPPPISEPDRITDVEKKYGVKLELPERTNEVAGQYSGACKDVGQGQRVPVLDLHTAFQQYEGWQRGLLDGGLHLTERGNRTVFRLLQELVSSEFPSLLPAAMADDAPDLQQIDPANPQAVFDDFYRSQELGGGAWPVSRHW